MIKLDLSVPVDSPVRRQFNLIYQFLERNELNQHLSKVEGVLVIKPESIVYDDCFAYVFDIARSSPELNSAIDDLVRPLNTRKPQEKDCVFYSGGLGCIEVKHIGIVQKDGKIVSKWGDDGPIVRHPLWAIPECYGNRVRFSRMPSREEVLRLRKKFVR